MPLCMKFLRIFCIWSHAMCSLLYLSSFMSIIFFRLIYTVEYSSLSPDKFSSFLLSKSFFCIPLRTRAEQHSSKAQANGKKNLTPQIDDDGSNMWHVSESCCETLALARPGKLYSVEGPGAPLLSSCIKEMRKIIRSFCQSFSFF